MGKVILFLVTIMSVHFVYGNPLMGYRTLNRAPITCEFKAEQSLIKSETVVLGQQEYIKLNIFETKKNYQVYYKIHSRDRSHSAGSYQEKVVAQRVYFSNAERFTVGQPHFLQEPYLVGFFPFSSLHGKAGSISFSKLHYGSVSYQNELLNCSESF